MAERRSITLDGFAAGSLLVAAVLACSLLSDWLAEPGAGLAATLIEALGIAAFGLLSGTILLALQLVFWRHWPKWAMRAIGWTFLVPGAAIIVDRVAPDPLAGGTVGAWLSAALEETCGP